MQRRSFLAGLGACAAAALSAADVRAQQFPMRPVRLVVPYEPGGTTDILARIVAPGWSQLLGQPIVVENRGGANSIIGTGQVARSTPDGHTLLVGSTAISSNATLYTRLPYDTLSDLSPVVPIALTPYFLIANAALPANSVQELVELARRRPGEIAYASAGVGGTPHLSGEMLALRAGVRLLHVPYRGTGPAMSDLASGRAQIMFTGLVTALPFIRSGQIKVLGAASEQRSEFLPEVPTIAEAGVPGVEADSWFAVLAPAGVSDQIEERLAQTMRTALEAPEVTRRLADLGAIPMPHTRQEFKLFYREGVEKWADIVRASGARVE